LSKTLAERFWAKVDISGDCWNWTAYKNGQGYGRIIVDGKVRFAHRVGYEMEVGPIPDGMVIDHICHNEACVKPSHLRACTLKQNNENRPQVTRTASGHRGITWHKASGKWYARITHNYQVIRLGLFDDLDEAKTAIVDKRLELFTHNDLDRTAA